MSERDPTVSQWKVLNRGAQPLINADSPEEALYIARMFYGNGVRIKPVHNPQAVPVTLHSLGLAPVPVTKPAAKLGFWRRLLQAITRAREPSHP